ncbi:hypothetical protein ASF30_09815 [Leifsonia sp. Leaf264]|nr:hypothetical protein ASF30_09815 [Leifsonia sp. Leaf264]
MLLAFSAPASADTFGFPDPVVVDSPVTIAPPEVFASDGRPELPDGTPVGAISLPTRTVRGPQTITSRVSGVRFEGAVTVSAGGVLENSVVVGDGVTKQALVTILDGGTVQDSTVRPQNPGQHVDGVRMAGGTLQRTRISHVGDGIGLVRGTAVVDHNWVSDLVLLSPDPGRVNDHSHDDVIQIHGGAGHQISYNRLDAWFTTEFGAAGKPVTRNAAGVLTGGNPRFPNTQAMSAIMFNNITSFPEDLTVIGNWVAGGAAAFNFGGLGTGNSQPDYSLGIVANNTFTGDQGNHRNLAAIGNPLLPVAWFGNAYTDGSLAKIAKS